MADLRSPPVAISCALLTTSALPWQSCVALCCDHAAMTRRAPWHPRRHSMPGSTVSLATWYPVIPRDMVPGALRCPVATGRAVRHSMHPARCETEQPCCAKADTAQLRHGEPNVVGSVRAVLPGRSVPSGCGPNGPKSHATMQRATMQRATMQRATMQRATMQRATMQRATMQRATMQRATMQRATMQRAAIRQHATHPVGRRTT
jgi:hypothetical protein